MIHELRVYRVMPGRMPAMLARFENVTLALFAKHGIKQVAFWTTLVGESNNDLSYLLEWESMAERERKWNAFSTDPDWIAKRTESERDGPIVQTLSNTLLAPTDFSALK